MNKEEGIYISARIPPSLEYHVRMTAAQLKSSRSQFIRQALEERLQRLGVIGVDGESKITFAILDDKAK